MATYYVVAGEVFSVEANSTEEAIAKVAVSEGWEDPEKYLEEPFDFTRLGKDIAVLGPEIVSIEPPL